MAFIALLFVPTFSGNGIASSNFTKSLLEDGGTSVSYSIRLPSIFALFESQNCYQHQLD